MATWHKLETLEDFQARLAREREDAEAFWKKLREASLDNREADKE